MTTQTGVQDVLDRIKTAQQKPLGDPQFKDLMGLEKSTYSESTVLLPGLPSTIWSLVPNSFIRC